MNFILMTSQMLNHMQIFSTTVDDDNVSTLEPKVITETRCMIKKIYRYDKI